MKRLMLAFALAAVAAATFVSAAPAQTTCNTTISDTTINGSVLVPNGANCRLIRVTVTGSVQVQPGGAIVILGGHVFGSVQSTGARWFRLDRRARVDGSVQVMGTTRTVPTFTANLICQSTIGGTIQVTSNRAPFLIGDFGNEENGCLAGNAVGQDIQISGNNAQVRVSNNAIGGSLQCSGNTPPATGNPGSNSVGGVKQGEGCAAA